MISAIPAFLAAALIFEGTTPHYDGPNCWNLAMVSSGILPALRHTPADEISFYLNSPLCREISRQEIQIGDIGIIRFNKSRANAEIHAFVHFSRNQIYSKNGLGNDSTYLKQAPLRMHKVYGGPTHELQHFRCVSMDWFLSANEVSTELSQALSVISAFEKDLQNLALFDQKIDFDSRGQFLKTLDAMANFEKRSEQDRFLYDALVLRIFGIEAQLNMAREEFLAVEVNSRRLNLLR